MCFKILLKQKIKEYFKGIIFQEWRNLKGDKNRFGSLYPGAMECE